MRRAFWRVALWERAVGEGEAFTSPSLIVRLSGVIGVLAGGPDAYRVGRLIWRGGCGRGSGMCAECGRWSGAWRGRVAVRVVGVRSESPYFYV